MIDIVMPNNNENEFIAIAKKLGYKSLYFLYSQSKYKTIDETTFQTSTKLKITKGILADKKTINKINKRNNALVVAKSSNNDRQILEKGLANLVYDFEQYARQDFMHHRASGLNHVLCKEAKNNGITIGFSVSSLINSKRKYLLIGRVMQNIQLCRKYRLRMKTASFATSPYEMRSPEDIQSLFVQLGMHPKEAQETLSI